MRYLIMYILIAVLIFIFYIQHQYYAEEFNNGWAGAAMLVIILLCEFGADLYFWKLWKELKRGVALIFLAVCLILMVYSGTVCFAVMVSNSEVNRLEKEKVRQKSDQKRQVLKEELEIVLNEKERQQKYLLEKTESAKNASKWTVSDVEKGKDKINEIIRELSEREIALKRKLAVQVENQVYTTLENFEKVTDINANFLGYGNKIIFSLLFAIIPFLVCYVLTDTDNKDESEEDIEEIAEIEDIESSILNFNENNRVEKEIELNNSDKIIEENKEILVENTEEEQVEESKTEIKKTETYAVKKEEDSFFTDKKIGFFQ